MSLQRPLTAGFQSARSLLRPAMLACAVFLVVLGTHRFHVDRYLTPTFLRYVENAVPSPWAPCVYVLVAGLAIACAVPRLLLAALAGHWFGAAGGFLWASLATQLGCCVTFAFSRRFLRSTTWAETTSSWRARFARLEIHGFEATLVLRALPVGNAFVTNLFLGMSPVRSRQFFFGTLLGSIPMTAVYCGIGETARRPEATAIWITSASLLVLAAVLFVLRRRGIVAADAAALEAESLREPIVPRRG